MPIKGRPRLVAHQASGTNLFVDDLREVIKLSQTEPRKTISDTLRELVMKPSSIAADKPSNATKETQFAEPSMANLELKDIKESLTNLAAQSHPLQPLLTEILGFTIAAEMKSHLLLQKLLLSRGVTEEAAHKLVIEQETRSRQHVETILRTILPTQIQKESE